MDDGLSPKLIVLGFHAQMFVLQLLRLVLCMRKGIAGFSGWHLGYHMLKHLAGSPDSSAVELVGFGFDAVDIALGVRGRVVGAFGDGSFLATVVPHNK